MVDTPSSELNLSQNVQASCTNILIRIRALYDILRQIDCMLRVICGTTNDLIAVDIAGSFATKDITMG